MLDWLRAFGSHRVVLLLLVVVLFIGEQFGAADTADAQNVEQVIATTPIPQPAPVPSLPQVDRPDTTGWVHDFNSYKEPGQRIAWLFSHANLSLTDEMFQSVRSGQTVLTVGTANGAVASFGAGQVAEGQPYGPVLFISPRLFADAQTDTELLSHMLVLFHESVHAYRYFNGHGERFENLPIDGEGANAPRTEQQCTELYTEEVFAYNQQCQVAERWGIQLNSFDCSSEQSVAQSYVDTARSVSGYGIWSECGVVFTQLLNRSNP